MQVTRLDARGLRRFADVRIEPGSGLNLITGDNGAGKTSLLEALHLMAYGRSFRGRVRDGLIRAGDTSLQVFVEWQEAVVREPADGRVADGAAAWSRTRKAGLSHRGSDWSGRLDGEDVGHLGELCAALAVVSFEPGSHALVTGPSEVRRRYLDWGLFHVEQNFLPLWRRYARALKQRNALLKSRTGGKQLDAWDHELADAGEPLSQRRQHYLDALEPGFRELIDRLAPSLGQVHLSYAPGWRRDELSLADALLLARDRDLLAGFTSVGPHRADWRIAIAGLPGREALSRGQAKLVALCALLAQAQDYARQRGEWPVVALDDLASELDRHHQQRVLDYLLETGAQVFVTGTDIPVAVAAANVPITMFHVEHGLVTRI
ncbi:DNA replication/repair protein RecF [Montanilutibacter psychrotolerans]|uniref:DNA replication and repair protein RecF n=1 Tax=Montanilutibacter psychrotolerans TaxID=1327343 RepID=A0A3M8SQS8_9GAMM|nr:DNA replication/repair protein RecF [Lysobacter psychrotolerans]RNF83688.1 DNA replication/repair protein RecF [Lysobacter psychrotolerans]